MIQQSQSSTFAQLIDQLRNKSEGELKMLYLKFFSSDLTEEWKDITQPSDFKNVTEDDIIRAIQKNRYRTHVQSHR